MLGEVAPLRSKCRQTEPHRVTGRPGGQHVTRLVEDQCQHVAGHQPCGVVGGVHVAVRLGDGDAGVVRDQFVTPKRPAHQLNVIATAGGHAVEHLLHQLFGPGRAHDADPQTGR